MHGSWSKERRSICAPAHSPRVVYFDLCSVNASFRMFLQQKSREQPGDRLRKRARSGGHAPAALGLTSDVNPFAHSLRASLDALAASDPSAAREAQGGYRHGVSGGRAVECDHTALP